MTEAFYKAAEILGAKGKGDLKQNRNPIRYFLMVIYSFAGAYDTYIGEIVLPHGLNAW